MLTFNISDVLQLILKVGQLINACICHSVRTEIEYLWYIFGGGLMRLVSKIEALAAYPPPKMNRKVKLLLVVLSDCPANPALSRVKWT